MNELGKFDYSQIITEDDLKAIGRELGYQYSHLPWWRPIYKWATGVSIGVIMGLIVWLQDGKNPIKNSGRNTGGVK